MAFLVPLKALCDESRAKGSQDQEFLGEDVLTRGVIEMLRTRETPLWIFLALQVQLEIHCTLKADASRAYAEVSAASTKTIHDLHKYCDFSEALGHFQKNYRSTAETLITQCQSWIQEDKLHWNWESDPGTPVSTEDNHALFKKHPLFCGKFLFCLNVLMKQMCLDFSDTWLFLPTLAHLYNAALWKG